MPRPRHAPLRHLPGNRREARAAQLPSRPTVARPRGRPDHCRSGPLRRTRTRCPGPGMHPTATSPATGARHRRHSCRHARPLHGREAARTAAGPGPSAVREPDAQAPARIPPPPPRHRREAQAAQLPSRPTVARPRGRPDRCRAGPLRRTRTRCPGPGAYPSATSPAPARGTGGTAAVTPDRCTAERPPGPLPGRAPPPYAHPMPRPRHAPLRHLPGNRREARAAQLPSRPTVARPRGRPDRCRAGPLRRTRTRCPGPGMHPSATSPATGARHGRCGCRRARPLYVLPRGPDRCRAGPLGCAGAVLRIPVCTLPPPSTPPPRVRPSCRP
ncbi:hypothetical protein M2160_001817 [Streptomyces sp. SAI-117]|nr:hypothetical protein [Streptomyces sp. SAI-117]